MCGKCVRSRLLSSGSAIRFTAKSFGCALRRAPYCGLKWRISSLTVGVWRPLRITAFGTNQGALVIMRKTLMLELEAVLQMAWLGVCCSWRVWICAQVASTFCWVWYPDVSVWSVCELLTVSELRDGIDVVHGDCEVKRVGCMGLWVYYICGGGGVVNIF
jgi:hypothetical protein